MSESKTPWTPGQVADQYKVVAHLARALAAVHEQLEPIIRSGEPSIALDIQGERSVHIMDVLGDILNGMDAVDDVEDAWTAPIFDAARTILAKIGGQS